MSHVDDGILHAYLDGALDALHDAGELPAGAAPADVVAHLDACPDCSSRLLIERERRDAAGAVLRDAVPQRSDIPPLPALAHRHAARNRTNWLPLGWAASLILAIGAGWWGSEIWRTQPQFAASQEATDAAQSEYAPAGSPASAPTGDVVPGTTREPEPAAPTPSAAGRITGQQPTAEEATAAAPRQAGADDATMSSHRPGARPNVDPVASTEALPAAPAPARQEGGVNAIRPPGNRDVAESAAAARPPAAAAARTELAATRQTPAAAPLPQTSAPAGQSAAAVRPELTAAAPRQAPLGDRAQAAAIAFSDTAASAFVLNAESALAFRLDSAANALRRRNTVDRSLEPMPGKPLTFLAANSFVDGATVELVDISGALAFDSILVQERSGELSFRPSSPNDRVPKTSVPVLSDGFAPRVEVASDSKRTIVRVTQTLLSGEVVQLVSWTPALTDARKSLLIGMRASRLLEDGRREVIVRSETGWLAIRGDLTMEEMMALVPALVSR